MNGAGPAGMQTGLSSAPCAAQPGAGVASPGQPGRRARPVVGADARVRDFPPHPLPRGRGWPGDEGAVAVIDGGAAGGGA